jgi:long-chain acyl-CoA synthetase
MSFRSIPAQFLSWGEIQPSAEAYAFREQDDWTVVNWKSYTDQVRAAACSLIEIYGAPGARVGILGGNSPRWAIFDMASMTAGLVTVAVYSTCAAAQIEYILGHAKVRTVLINGEDAWERFVSVADRLPDVSNVILSGIAPGFEPGVTDAEVLLEGKSCSSWDSFMDRGESVSQESLDERIEDISPGDLAQLIYTSGTTGRPKGAMLTHGNLAAASEMGRALLPGSTAGMRHLSFLPLAHAAERALSILGPATRGYAVFFNRRTEDLRDDLRAVRPHLYLGVPRVWEKTQAAMESSIGASPIHVRWIVRVARMICRAHNDADNLARFSRFLLRVPYYLISRPVFARMKAQLGFDRTRHFFTGAAPIAPGLLRYMASLDIVIQEIYGQTEDCGPTSFNRLGSIRWGSVGPPFEGVRVRIAEDGEILVAGPHVFEGYLDDDTATRDVLRDGWLYSGDLGHIDEEGYLYVTGRKKELLITAGGKNISPVAIELLLKRDPVVEEAVVIGDGRKYLVALLALDRRRCAKDFPDHGPLTCEVCSPESDPGMKNEDLSRYVSRLVRSVNARVSRVETIKKFAVLPNPLSIESGELTPTMKVKRHAIEAIHVDIIDAMYSS